MRSLTATLIALVALIAPLAGCGGDESGDAPSDSTGSTITDPAASGEAGGGGSTGGGGATEKDPSEGNEEAESAGEPLDERGVRNVIDRFLTSGDPAACTDSVTEKLVRRAFGGVRGCEAAATAAPAVADSVLIKSVDVRPDRAEAKIVPDGGATDGLSIDVTVIATEDGPKIDGFRAKGIAPGP